MLFFKDGRILPDKYEHYVDSVFIEIKKGRFFDREIDSQRTTYSFEYTKHINSFNNICLRSYI